MSTLPPTIGHPAGFTITQDGETVDYAFEGRIHARGIEFTADETGDVSRIRWLRASDGALVAEVHAYDYLHDDLTEGSIIRVRAVDAEGTDHAFLVAEVEQGGRRSVRVGAGDVNTPVELTLLDELGASDYLRKASALAGVGEVVRADLATITRTIDLGVAFSTQASPNTWPDASTNTLYLFAVVPDDYVSGALTWRLRLRAVVTGGNIVFRRSIQRTRIGAALATIDSGIVQDFSPATTNTLEHTGTIAAANVQAGDVLRFDWMRVGADAGDTHADGIRFDGATLEYTGRA